MATIRLEISGDGIARITAALDNLASPRHAAALRRAVNHTGDKAFTLVRRTLTRQMGLSSQKLFKDGRTLIKQRAVGASLDYQIVSRGRAVRAKEFAHSVTRRGISFAPWGKRRFIKSAFVIPRYASNLYRRRTPSRFPLEALYGPNLNKELVKDATAQAFQIIAATDLPGRVEHEVRVITSGILS